MCVCLYIYIYIYIYIYDICICISIAACFIHLLSLEKICKGWKYNLFEVIFKNVSSLYIDKHF